MCDWAGLAQHDHLCDWAGLVQHGGGDLCVIGLVWSGLARQLTVQMMQNPQILAALQERLDGLVGSPSGYMERYTHTPVPLTAYRQLFTLNCIVHD